MSEIATWFEIVLLFIPIIFTAVMYYGVFVRQQAKQTADISHHKETSDKEINYLKDEIKKHSDCMAVIKSKHDKMNAHIGKCITEPQHDILQSKCQRDIFRAIDDIKKDIERHSSKQDTHGEKLGEIVGFIQSLRGELKGMGVLREKN